MSFSKVKEEEVEELVQQIKGLQRDSKLTRDQISEIRKVLGITETDAVRNVDPNFFTPSTDNQTTIAQPSEMVPESQIDGRRSQVDPGKLQGEFYSMSSGTRGKALIFQNDKFNEDRRNLHENRRYGTQEDLAKMKCRFEERGFEAIPYFDKTKKDTMDVLREAANNVEYNRNADCFTCVILSHGSERGIEAVDFTMDVEDILSIFYASNCPSLAGKPKIFIFQCCRGGTLCKGLDVDLNVSDACSDDTEYKKKYPDEQTEQTLRIPDHADFLIIYASRRGYGAFRNTEVGSPFIINLSEEMENMEDRDDMYSVLTKMNHRFYSYKPTSPDLAENTQMPCFESTLTRKLRLPSH